MHLKHLSLKNFRGLENIEFDLEHGANIIVGPNAIGKTTILEAIRLAKALLAPRTAHEPNQALTALGAIVPYDPSELLVSAIARDPQRLIEIRCRYELSLGELAEIEKNIPLIARGFVQANLGQGFSNPSALVAFLSSPEGRNASAAAEKAIRHQYAQIASDRICRLELTINSLSAEINNIFSIESSLIAFLDRRLAPNRTVFSYFPADRALPPGEPSVQIGAADTAQQVESHNSQPQLKYSRLKNTIFNAVITGEEQKSSLEQQFNHIFARVLKGRRLVGVGVNRFGLLSVMIEDTETGRQFSLDAMSSGEKGLILTFLLVANSIERDGMILLDEPELHLNPAVCKDVLSFIVDEYVVPKNIQAVICSHSAEILAGAFDTEKATLYHLISENMITRVRHRDQDVIAEALRSLGTSETEGLLYKGTIFVEGKEDVEILQAGFNELLRRYILKDRAGRREVEKQIRLLQDAEKRGERLSPQYFIFDKDNEPTGLANSSAVRILQWERRCLENYLIDVDILTDLLTDKDLVQRPLANEGEVSKLLRELAMAQLDEIVSREVYEEYKFPNPGIRNEDIKDTGFIETAEALFMRLKSIKHDLSLLSESWAAEFVQRCEKRKKDLEVIWATKWNKDCDGKKLFFDIQRRITPRVSLLRFKKTVITAMQVKATENWRSVESLLKTLLDTKPNA